jgi:fucose permease
MFNLLLPIIYIAFISLGLPDALLGSAWPLMRQDLNVPLSYAGFISMIIALGTIFSSLQSDRLTKKLGTSKVTLFSVILTAISLFGFSTSSSFFSLCLWAIPYGLGAGSVDASLNNYVALNYSSRYMSWLHCFWGVGASIGPAVMGIALSSDHSWGLGYTYIGLFQVILSVILLVSLPLWKNKKEEPPENSNEKAYSLRQIFKISGAKPSMLTFLCYCGIEQTTGLWATSYLVLSKGVLTETAAKFAGLFFLGIALGRGISGFLTIKFNDDQMVKIGHLLILSGILVLLFSQSSILSISGLILIGLGCAPIYPSIIHSTPERFGKEKSQAIIGIQMASAYVGTCSLPPLFGLFANSVGVYWMPFFLFVLLVIMYRAHITAEKQLTEGNIIINES